MVKGECYFLVGDNNKVSQMEYAGYHAETDHYAFNPLDFCNSIVGEYWVKPESLKFSVSLGKLNTGSDFDRSISAMLE